MNKNIAEYPFEFSPKLIKFLGEELIHDKKIAIAELVKNAYDADASEVTLTVGDNEIIIEDNGYGMNSEVIRKKWLKVGDSDKSVSSKPSPKYKRLPIGEKGIGRLGVHKLGRKIQIVSKTSEDPEINFEIDWNQFEHASHLQELSPILIASRDLPEIFVNGTTGTRLVVRDLKEPIAKKDLQSLNVDLIKLMPPFKHSIQENFQIKFITKNGLFEDVDLLDITKIIDHAFFHYKIILHTNKEPDIFYSFRSPNEKKITSRKLSSDDKDMQDIILNLQKNNPQVPGNSNVGKVIFEGYIFDRKYLDLFKEPYPKKELKNYLEANGGIRVYRDGMRIYNYGEGGKDNDILNLDRKRAKRIGDNIGYNQILASIELDRAGSKGLTEKTNREGFIHNETFSIFQNQLDFYLEAILHCRKIDRANMEPLFGKEYDKGDINTKIKEIVSQVDKLQVSDNDKSKIKNKLHEFSQEFDQLKNIFLTASNTGLNLTFIIHEIDKIISHLEEKIKSKNIDQIEHVFIHLKNSIDAYRDVIRLDKKASSISVATLIKQALFNAEYRFHCHHIKHEIDMKPNLIVTGKKGLILGIFTNLFDNAIYWLDYREIAHKRIYIHIYQEGEYIFFVVADNGKGFTISFDAALRPFISGRTDESSMGIGLHLAEQVMIAHEGSISSANWQEEKLPEEFSEGAIIKLKFKKG